MLPTSAKSRPSKKLLTFISLVLALYGGTYLWLRHSRYLVHRAGYYADPPTTHYIAPGKTADGPQIFASAMLQFAAAGKEPEPHELEAALLRASEIAAVAAKRREKLLLFFKPLTLAEEVFWKVVNPSPNVS